MHIKLRKAVSIMLVALLMLSVFCANGLALGYGEEWETYYNTATTKYTDVPPTHWAYNAVMRATEKNWFGGYPDKTFRPDGSITRAEAVTVFVKFTGLELGDVTQSSFYDVDESIWYAPYVEAGKDLFPTHTSVQGKRPFQPEMPVTREDTIYALVRALGYDVGVKSADQSVLNMFSDKNSISNDIKPYFAIALKNELVSGFPDGTIRAQDSLTRAEFATLLYKGSFVGNNDAHEAKISSVSVSPQSPAEIEIGQSITLSARAQYTDGTSKPYTALDPYDASGSGVISLNGTTITGLKEGTVTIKYNDSYLKNDSFVVVVKNPGDAPKIKITDYPEQTDLASADISGSVSDKELSTVDLTCNGKDVKINADGSFTVNTPLKVGENTVKFIAVNKYNVSAEREITIVRTDTPLISITKYKERTESRRTTVEGYVTNSDIDSVTLTCNGKLVKLNSDGSFVTEVELKLGKNLFSFVATNGYGNSSEQIIAIIRYEVIEDDEDEDNGGKEELPGQKIIEWEFDNLIPEEKYSDVEIILIIDDSGSMGWNDPGNLRLSVAADLIDNLPDSSKIGVVSFANSTNLLTGRLTSDKNEAKSFLNNRYFEAYGGTYMYGAINDSFNLFESNGTDILRMAVVLSDGDAHDTSRHAETINAANNNSIKVYTVGLGVDVSYFNNYLKPLASATGAAFYLTSNASELKQVFADITEKIDLVTDSDGDGIPDYYEDNMKDANGVKLAIDKTKADTDGDGIPDGDEIILTYSYTDKTTVKVSGYMVSDPTKADSDGDGYDDGADAYPLDPAFH